MIRGSIPWEKSQSYSIGMAVHLIWFGWAPGEMWRPVFEIWGRCQQWMKETFGDTSFQFMIYCRRPKESLSFEQWNNWEEQDSKKIVSWLLTRNVIWNRSIYPDLRGKKKIFKRVKVSDRLVMIQAIHMRTDESIDIKKQRKKFIAPSRPTQHSIILAIIDIHRIMWSFQQN